MVSTKDLTESKYINADLVAESPTKKCIILTEGKLVENKFGMQLVLTTQMDKKMKEWRPNKVTLSNFQEAWGEDSAAWVNKLVELKLDDYQEKKIVVGYPAIDKTKHTSAFTEE